MRLADFEALVRRLAAEVPPDFLEGVTEISVSAATLPHPTRAEVYTLGECIPDPLSDDGGLPDLRSRILLYHGSFLALARQAPGFDWETEAYTTLTHELRHHLEWRARSDALEDFDRAAEENFARHDGEPFDPLFYLGGEEVVKGIYQVDDDFFLDRVLRKVPARLEVAWHGARYRAALPPDLALPAFVSLEGLAEPPPGEVIVALRRRPSLLDLFRRSDPVQVAVAVTPVAD